MPVIGVTGGIATGKSTVTQSLLRRLPAEVFDADAEVHALLEGSDEIRAAVTAVFGSDYYSTGRLDRSRLRGVVFTEPEQRRRLEAILHPPIRTRWTMLAERARRERAWLIVDIPLLYETGAESHCDRVVVVACTPHQQRNRLATRPGLDPDTAKKIVAAQLDLSTKIQKADHLIWNDSTLPSLERQVDLLADWLTQIYG